MCKARLGLCDRLYFQENPSTTVSQGHRVATLKDRVAQSNRRLQSVTEELRQLKKSLGSRTKDVNSDDIDGSSEGGAPATESDLLEGRDSLPSGRSIADTPFGLSDDMSLLDLGEAQLGDCRFCKDDVQGLFLL